MTPGRLLHVGNVVVDLVLDVATLPERGGDVLATRSARAPGGGFNVMTAAARQGLHVAYAGAHGTGPFGDLARSGMREAGIQVLHPARTALDTGFVVAVVDGGGERTFLTSPGAEATLTGRDLDTVSTGAGDVVCASGYGMLHAANRVALAGWLPRVPGDVPLVFDPGPLVGQIPPDVMRAVLPRIDWWTCNAREAAAVTGHADPVRAAAALRDLTGRRGVLVRTGPDGCVVAERGAPPVAVPGFPVDAVDMNGAGDAHTGVFVAALAAGSPATDAARTANAAAALAVTVRGPATAPSAEELSAFLRQRGLPARSHRT
ncbi:PfkB family carbohydrate kinase [Planotetraspora kaengkrachanensis]|uniref:Carbohydrate kinase n=1 Tax=Planotetraspora kaengkrachanensis TaxID=575193 RepID=A0A8J3PS20_9ACTN|nr:PfkB family carbohydrate kinase [Planotetraspora kaengkrachanensis]GIG80431.1 carbohydrate kinase [Planotetraspora kaengkrachanensis]